jgi:serine protease Do
MNRRDVLSSLGDLFVLVGLFVLAVGLIIAGTHVIDWWRSDRTAFVLGPLPDSSVRELSLDEVERSLNQIVVPIVNQVTEDRHKQGSAVAIEPHYLLTVCHIGEGDVLAFVDGEPVGLRLIAARRSYDQCLFEAERPLPHVVPGVRSVSSLLPHERLYAFGYPSATPTLSIGKFSDVIIDEDGVHMIRTNARTSPGNSGGGLFDRFGNLIGIMRLYDEDKASFAVPVEDWWKSHN